MRNTLNIIIVIYIIATFFSFIVLVSSIKTFKAINKTIVILLSIAAGWAILDNLFWLIFEDRISAILPIIKKVPLVTEYSDYIITTPLSLYTLSLFAMKNLAIDKSIIPIIIASDIIMMLLGVFAEYSTSYMRYVWFWAAVIPFIVVLYLIWKTLRLEAKKQSRLHYKSYLHLSAYVTFFWTLYPIFWYLSPYGIRLISITQVEIVYHFVNIFTKAGFYLLMYRKLNRC